MFKESLVNLAMTRRTIKAAEADLADVERKLKQREPELVTELENIRALLAESRSKEKNLAITIRMAASENPTEAENFKPWLQSRMQTIVMALETNAIRLAMLFCPMAIKLDQKLFDTWAIKHRTDILLYEYGVEIVEKPGYVIKSDLDEYLTQVENEATAEID